MESCPLCKEETLIKDKVHCLYCLSCRQIVSEEAVEAPKANSSDSREVFDSGIQDSGSSQTSS